MDRADLEQIAPWAWRIPKTGPMRADAVIYADAALIDDMDEKVRTQIVNVASLPGIVRAAWAMPVARVVEVAERAGLARRVARLTPMICIKG